MRKSLINSNDMASKFHGVSKIVSGGQTGVDRAALDVAIEIGLAHGGWCPKGRLCEGGVIDSRYALQEHASPEYSARTRQNVVDSDGTLVLYQFRLSGGTALTCRLAGELNKPLCRVRLDRPSDPLIVVRWLLDNRISVLNVAGPRGSAHPKLELLARRFLINLFSQTADLFLD